MEMVFEGMLALSYFCAGTACAGIVLAKLNEEVPATSSAHADEVATASNAMGDLKHEK